MITSVQLSIVLTRALQSLPEEPIEERSTVVAPGEALVRVDLEAVGNVDLEAGRLGRLQLRECVISQRPF